MNMPATKTSTWDTYSALPGSEKFILDKNWPQDPISMVTSFLSILSTSAFHLLKLIFSVVTSFVLLSEEKISKNKKKMSKNPKKNNDNPKIEKKEGQKWNNI